MSRTKFLSGVFVLALPALAYNPGVQAMPAFSEPLEVTQGNGVVFEARLMGDEWCNWTETLSGHVIAQDSRNQWHFVTGYVDDRPLSGALVGASGKGSLEAGLLPPCVERFSPNRKHPVEGINGVSAAEARTIPAIFIMAQFTDRKGQTAPEGFADAVGTELLKFFDAVSYGADRLELAQETSGTANDGIVGWVDLPYRHPNTGSSTGRDNKKISKDAIEAADEFVDFAAYDSNNDGYVDSDELAITIIVAGYERAYGVSRPSIWAHQWNLDGMGGAQADGVRMGLSHGGRGGYAQFGELQGRTDTHVATMGVMAHELGHLIYRLPDLYDYDSTSNGSGAWCLMSYGAWGWSTDDVYQGQTPVAAGAWVRYQMGWSQASSASSNSSFVAIGSDMADGENALTMAQSQQSQEFFLIENRQPLGYDRGLEMLFGEDFGGLAIWHIDDSQSGNSNDQTRLADVEEADGSTSAYEPSNLWGIGSGDFNLESQPSSRLNDGSPTDVSVTNISRSGETMTADVED